MLETILTVVGLVWYLVIWSLGLLGLCVARQRYNGRQAAPSRSAKAPQDAPGVSILRPLRGYDCNLYENLESSFLQEYAKYEIIFSVAEEGDVAIPIVQELIEKYPNVDAKLIIGEEVVGINPKINNLVRSFDAAKYDIIWVIDSNVLTETSTLANSVELLTATPAPGKRAIGLIHHLPFAIYPDDNLGSRVEQAFLCSTHAKMYLAINYVSIDSCVNGKSCLYRKSDVIAAAAARKRNAASTLQLEERDGLASFGQYLGEDNMLGEAIWHELGMRHAMGGEVAGNAVGSMSFETYCRRRVRWIRVRKYMVTASTLVEPLTECFACALLGAAVLKRLLFLSPFLLIPAHVVAWFMLDVTIFNTLARSSPKPGWSKAPYHDGPGSLAFVRAWLVRESMAFPIWLFAMLGDTVTWRTDGKVYKVRKNGTVRLLRDGEKEAWCERVLAKVQARAGGRRYITLTPDDGMAASEHHYSEQERVNRRA